MSPDPTSRVLHDIDDALAALQSIGFGQSLPNGTGGHWKQASDEATRITGDHAERHALQWIDVLLNQAFRALAQGDPTTLRSELIRLAATATAWVEDIDRKAGK